MPCKQRGAVTTEVGKATVALHYRGLDDHRRRTSLQFDPVPDRLTDGVAAYAFDLQPNENRSVYVTVTCDRTVAESKPLP